MNFRKLLRKLENEREGREYNENCTYHLKGKLRLSPLMQRQGPRCIVSSEGLTTEINILIRSPMQVLTEAADA